MISQKIEKMQTEYSLPAQLNNPNWRKYLDNYQTEKQMVLDGIINIRKYLSQPLQVNHLITEVLRTQIHKPLIKYVRKILQRVSHNKPTQIELRLLHEILWIFTNLCSGSKNTTYEIVELGIINFCKQLFQIQNCPKIAMILFQLIGNLACQLSMTIKIGFLEDQNFYIFMKQKYRDYVEFPKFHQKATWALSNLFRDFEKCNDKLSLYHVQNIILGYYPVIQQLLKFENEQAVVSLLSIFLFLTRTQPFNMKQTMKIIERFLFSPIERIKNLVIQIIGQYIFQCDQAIEYAIKSDVFVSMIFRTLKQSQIIALRKQCAQILSNIFSGTVEQVEDFVKKPNLFSLINQVLNHQKQQEVIKQIIWAISNCCLTCSQKAFQSIYYSGIIEALSQKLLHCQQKPLFNLYTGGLLHFLQKFNRNPHLDFNMFLRNLTYIEPVLNLASQYPQVDQLQKNIHKCQQKINEIKLRGPITEQQMVNNYMNNFTV